MTGDLLYMTNQFPLLNGRLLTAFINAGGRRVHLEHAMSTGSLLHDVIVLPKRYPPPSMWEKQPDEWKVNVLLPGARDEWPIGYTLIPSFDRDQARRLVDFLSICRLCWGDNEG